VSGRGGEALVMAEVCVRGLPCLPCNTALGLIERTYELARAYLDSSPAPLVVVDAA
jgi:hypothetical protein